jgi:hypothetical protein
MAFLFSLPDDARRPSVPCISHDLELLQMFEAYERGTLSSILLWGARVVAVMSVAECRFAGFHATITVGQDSRRAENLLILERTCTAEGDFLRWQDFRQPCLRDGVRGSQVFALYGLSALT